MVIWRTAVSAVLLALPVFSEPAKIMYYNFFGDYLAEQPYEIDIDVPNTTLREIQAALENLRNTNHAMKSDLVIIGYGPAGHPEEFFAATPFVNYEIPLHMALDHVPERRADSIWYIYYVDSSLSHYVRARKDLFWASPFRWLAQIGLQDLHYFGPY